MKNIHGVKIYTVSISRSQKLHGQKNTETNKIHGIEIHGAESAHLIVATNLVSTHKKMSLTSKVTQT